MLKVLHKLIEKLKGHLKSFTNRIFPSSKTIVISPTTTIPFKVLPILPVTPIESTDSTDEDVIVEEVVEDVVEIEEAEKKIGKVEFFKDKRGKWRWRFTVNNGNIIAKSSESYHNYKDAYRSIEIVFSLTSANVHIIVDPEEIE